MKPLLVSTTASSIEEARLIAGKILEAKLAACVQIVPGVESHYWWKEKKEKSSEFFLLIKTGAEHFDALAEMIKKNHSYECPEIVALPVDSVEKSYLQWWKKNL